MVVRVIRPLLLLAALGVLLTGCEDPAHLEGSARPTVVATTTQAADLVRNVAGDRVVVRGVLAPNSDPHDYEVRPEDVKALSRADLVVRSGGEVDEWLDGAIDSAGADAPVVGLLDAVAPGSEDPHWWQDPRLALLAVEAIRAGLVRADPAGERAYAAGAGAYTERLRALDAVIARCLRAIPAAERVVGCLLYTSPSPRDRTRSRMPSSA